MKRTNLLLTFILFFGHLSFAQNWDILDKSMSSYDQNGGASTNLPWAVAQGGSAGSVATQQDGYVNFTKTSTGQSAKWAWLRPQTAFANLTSGTPYSIEVKVRVNAIGIAGGAIEANQISLRLGSENVTAPIFIKYGDAGSGSVATSAGGANAYTTRTSDWRIYRWVFHAGHATYDVYIDGVEEPVFENVATGPKADQNGVYFGAESQHCCNMDIEYVKMGTGDCFSKPRISSVTLSKDSQVGGVESTVSATAYTTLMDNGETLLFSLVDNAGNETVAAVEATVTNNVATTNIVIPATVAYGQYAVQVAAKNQVGGRDVTPKTVPYEIKDPVAAQTWDVLDRNFSVKAWNVAPAWALEKGDPVPPNFVSQSAGYVNIHKTLAAGNFNYAFLTSPPVNISPNTAYTYEIKARAHAIDKTEFPDVLKPAPGVQGGYEANQIGFLLNNKHMSLYLIYGDEQTGYVAAPVVDGTGVSPSYTLRYALNTSEWHVYRLIFNADNTKYDIYVDGTLVFEEIPLFNKTGNNVAKTGGESWQRCDMDIEYARMATGDLVTGGRPKILSAALSSDSHVFGNARTVQVTARTSSVNNGEKLRVSFTGETGDVIPAAEMTVNANKAACALTIPATVPLGKYAVTVAAPDGTIDGQELRPKIMPYAVVGVSPIDAKMLPQVKPVGYVKDINEYVYHTEKREFIFPSIVDTKKYTVDGKFSNGTAPIDRYYLFYAPHDNPGGIYLSTAPTMDGPWTEYAGTEGMTPGTVMDFAWAERQSDIIKNGAERHISACQVVWNTVQGKYIMYFHGPNPVTHYAVSDDLLNWTFGATILTAHQFSPINAEASYAKVFEHEIAGLDNKYVLLLMGQENQIRRIYWAHSKDGLSWTPILKPLISPDLDYKKIPGTDIKPNYDGGGTGAYGNNVSGPFLMERNGRYFVFVHGCTDHLLVVEVGENFDMEVHWGEYLRSTDANFTVNGTTQPTRIAAPDFLQDDNGRWYMFFEAGGRLGANIGYAREDEVSNSIALPSAEGLAVYPSVVNRGGILTIGAGGNGELSVEIIDLYGNSIVSAKGNVRAPEVPGLYFVKITAGGNTVGTSKIIVK
jgi:hypothetical protein